MKATTAVILATFFLVAFYILLNFDASIVLTGIVFLASPVIIIGMVLVVLADNSKKYPALKKNEEWGYSDKKKEDLWII